MNSNVNQNYQKAGSTDNPPASRGDVIWAWTLFAIVVITALGAFISKAVGSIPLMTAFASVSTLTMTFAAVRYLIRKSLHDAPRSKAVSEGNSVESVVAWNTLWLIPSLLMFFGIARSIAGVTPDGIALGVIAVIALIPIIPTYIVLGIKRAIRRRRRR